MSQSNALKIEENNLSIAWARAFQAVAQRGGKEITPLVVSITGFTNGEPPQVPEIRKELDNLLQRHEKFTCETVANTLFPYSLWNQSAGRNQLFERYLNMLPALKKSEKNNSNGLYFERLIAYGDKNSKKINQLDHIIRTYRRGNHRRSALQALIFLPSVDHTHQRQRGFPCMQQVMFAPTNKTELAITGVYTTQYLFERAYGNYLGLSRLGQFVAHELGLTLTRVTCMTGVAMLGKVNKRDVSTLLQLVNDSLDVSTTI